jgi:regulator of RNase E activity RraA
LPLEGEQLGIVVKEALANGRLITRNANPALAARSWRLEEMAACFGVGASTSFRQMVGRAHTVRFRDDFLTVIQALCDAEHGKVLVVDGGGGTRALAGELFATEAVRRKLAGIVIDGACRDTAKLTALHLPLYARCQQRGLAQGNRCCF